MKTDRELLELAARAAGYLETASIQDGYGFIALAVMDEDGDWTGKEWNPLQGDGDAQRLRNKLRIDVFYTDQGVNVAHDDVLLAFEPWGTNDLVTERRAITRAAAQMQLNKEQANG